MATVKTVDSFDPENPTVLTFRWSDGIKSVYDFKDFPVKVIVFVLWHGFKQLLGDKHSATFKETGSIPASREASDEKWNSLKSGETHQARQSTPWIFEAIAAVWKVTPEQAVEFYNKLDEATQKALPETPKVKKWKAERDLAKAEAMGESKIDFDALIAKLPATDKKSAKK